MDGGFGDTGGDNVNVGNGDAGQPDTSANPDAMTSNGMALGFSFSGFFSGLAAVAQAVFNAITAELGIPSAQASSIVILAPDGSPAGWTSIPGLQPGMNLAQALINAGAKMDADGKITQNGLQVGSVNMTAMGPFGGLYGTVGPTKADSVTVIDPNSGVSAIGPGFSGELTGFQDANGAQFLITPSAPRTMRTSAICSSQGIVIMSGGNGQEGNLLGGRQAFMDARWFGGKDGIYSAHTGRRVVPPQIAGQPLTAGFSVGPGANYQPCDLLMVWAASGYSCLCGASDVPVCLDPTTGRTLAIVGRATVQVYNGSQQIVLLNAEGQPPVAVPTAAAPGYYSLASGVLGLSDFVQNAAFVTPAEWTGGNYNSGGELGGGPG